MTLPSVNPSGRVQVYPSPVAAPGQCGMCGKAEHPKGFVDIRMDFEFYGVLYFCYDCVGDIGRAVGFYAPEDLSSLRARVERQDDELVILREAILGMESTVDGLLKNVGRIGRRVDPTGTDVVISPVPDPGTGSGATEPVVSEPAGPPPEPAGGGTPEVGATAQPVSVEGPNDLHDANATVDDILGTP